MVGRSDHQDAVVVAEAVDFVEEVGADGVGDDAVEVFEDEEAGGRMAGFGEDAAEGVFGAAEAGEGADVEGWGWGGAGVEGVHHCFYGDCFAVAAAWGLGSVVVTQLGIG